LSVVIGNFHIFRSGFSPAKADTELIVDPDRMLPLSILDQTMKVVARGNGKVFQGCGGGKHRKFAAGHLNEIRRESLLMACQTIAESILSAKRCVGIPV
jgi:hypothetical protein